MFIKMILLISILYKNYKILNTFYNTKISLKGKFFETKEILKTLLKMLLSISMLYKNCKILNTFHLT